jgi:uncharacterized OsmC-like protein
MTTDDLTHVPSTAYRVHAATVGHGSAEVTNGQQVLPLDTAWESEPSGRFGPAELLTSALAACLLKGLERSARLMPFSYDSATVEVIAERQDSPPRFTAVRYELTIVTGESDRRVQLLHENLRKFGTVFNTLSAACDVQGTVHRPRPSDRLVSTATLGE